MKQRKFLTKALAGILCVLMLTSVIPVASFAAYNKDFVSETHDVFKSTSSTLAPGVDQYINYAYAKDGKQMVYYVATADITRDDVVIQTSYLKQHENGIMGMDKLTNQIAYANQKYSNPEDSQFISEYYNVVAGVNASFYNMTTGQPIGITYIDGVSFGTASYDNFFAILKDGKTAVIDYAKNIGNYVDENGNSTIWQAAAGSQWLVRDGKDVTAGATGSYNTQRHSRTCVGVTAEGKVVMMVLDGRQEPFSCGGSMHELAQIMLEAGCVAAVNLDGGGSTTYASRPEGSDAIEVINRPSDGSERSISSGLIIASTAVPSNAFDHVTMNASDEYVTPGTSTEVTVAGVSSVGSAADIPGDLTYTVTNGTYANGVLTAGEAGDVVLTAVHGGREVGSLTIHAVIPEKLAFATSEIVVPFGKSVTLALAATYGLNEVKLKADDISFALENDKIGAISGFEFTAGNGEATESGITATFVGTEVTASTLIKLGKGSETIFDFEDGDTSMFDLGYIEYNYTLPEGKVYPVTAETGKVHSGNGAMALDINYGNSLESGYMMTALEYKGGEQKFENATKLGMWIYISDEDVSTWIRYTVYPLVLNDDGEYVRGSDSITNTLADDINSTTGFVNTFEEPGWHYLSIDLSKYKGLDLLNSYIVQFYISDRDGASYNYYYNQHKSYNGRYVMYVDDITVDYSDAVDDREAPVFGDVTYATTNMSDAVAIAKDAVPTVNDNTLSFAVKVADNTKKSNFTGLDASTAKAYIDGVETACTLKDGVMSVSDAVLADGVHHVKFSVCDNMGNYASIIRAVNVQANAGISTVKVVAHDASLDKILLGSVWYADIVATDIEKVQSVTVDIDLNNMSRWELDHMNVAPGFSAEYSIQDDENIATVTVTRVGSNDSTGEGVLVSMPIRTWELKMGYNYTSGTKNGKPAYTYAQFKSMKEFWPVDISMDIDRGVVSFVDGETATFSGVGPQVDTEMYKMAKDMISTTEGKAYYDAWNGGHIHTAEAIADKAATCTESGYTGRTFCEVCNSVVDWGTTVPATGHNYVDGKCVNCHAKANGIVDGKLYVDGILANGIVDGKYYVDGVLLNGYVLIDSVYYTVENGEKGGVYTGLVENDGKWGYSKLGALSGGWVMIDDEWYYFDTETLTAVSTYNNGKVTFEFKENGKLVSGQWYITAAGARYYYGPNYYGHGWHTIDGYDYYFGDANVEPGYRYEGLRYVINSNSHTPQWYDFGTDGKAVKLDTTGLLTVSGKLYYLVDGISQTGLQLVDGEYYYFSGTYEAKSGIVYVSNAKNNSLLPEGYYLFKDNYAMANNEFGLWQNSLRYIRNGQPCFAGLILNEDGKIIYIGSDCMLGKGTCTVSAGKTNGLLPEGTYAFGEDGVLVDNAFAMWQGNMCYMRNGQPYAAGLVRIGEDIYYIRSNCQAATGMYWAAANKTNGILEEGFYLFHNDGTLIDGEFADWKGENCYIVMGRPYFAGVIEYNGKTIYVGSDCKLKTGVCYVTDAAGNGILSEGYYYFTESGELLASGFAKWTDGVTYYFRNGQRTAAGVIELDGSIYYVNSGCRPVTGKYFVPANKGNGILEEGYYTFDSNGKLIQN